MKTPKVMEIMADLDNNGVIELDASFSVDDIKLTADIDAGINLGGTKDYRRLNNKPSINGTELYDNYDEIDPTVPDWAKTPEKPDYTAEEVGAVDVDDTITKLQIDVMFLKIFGD